MLTLIFGSFLFFIVLVAADSLLDNVDQNVSSTLALTFLKFNDQIS